MTTIMYVGEDKAIPVADATMTILDVSIAHKIPHVRACGGHGRCTTCRIRIRDGIHNVSARTPREVEVANALRWDGFTRLGCPPVTVRKAQAVLKGRRGAFQLVEVCGFAAPDAALLVQSTVGVLLQHQKRFTQHLYRRLFALAPAAQALFHGDMDSQGQMLTHMMQFLVHAMSRPEIMALGLRDLGRRHDAYGVAAEYYPAFRQAFLEAAREILGERHTAQVEKAWADTVDMIIESMRGPGVG